MVRKLALLAACFAILPCMATEPAARFMSFTLENDFFAGYDRHYTNGLQVAFVTPLDALPAGVRALPPIDWSAGPEVVFAFGQRIYTPVDTRTHDPDPADRPYA